MQYSSSLDYDFVFLSVKKITYSPDIVALCEPKLKESIDDPSNFTVRSYLPSILNDSVSHMHDLAAYMKEGRPLARDSNSDDLDLCDNWLSSSVLYISHQSHH